MAALQQALDGASTFGGTYDARLSQPGPDGAQLITDSRLVARTGLPSPVPYAAAMSPAVLAALRQDGTYDALVDERGTRVIGPTGD